MPPGATRPTDRRGARPNVVVVVLDCVRSGELPEGDGLPSRLPFLQKLREESVTFPRCASVSHWTVPSHASLLTGLYPWSHGLFLGGLPRLAPSTPLLARELSRAGYRTAAFSANGLLNPSPGWLDGFDEAAWGSSAYRRSSRSEAPPNRSGPEPEVRAPLLRRPGLLRWLGEWGVVGFERFPVVLDAYARWEARRRGDPDRARPVLSPWIEPTFDRWVRGVPEEEPLFALVNLMDGHEPYLIDREDGLSPKELRRAARVRQDHYGWIKGRWRPTPEEAAWLHRLYRGAIRALDGRLERLVRSLREAGRWEETLFVLTSDHGQAFGEDGLLYHMLGVSDAVLRVPLWVRWPHGEHGGRTAQGWASLIDVPATVRRAVGVPTLEPGDARPLDGLIGAPRDGPVFAICDGATFGDLSGFVGRGSPRTPGRRAVIGFEGEWKAVRDVPIAEESSARVARVGPPLPGATAGPPDALLRAVESAAARFQGWGSPPDAEVDRRLRAWGYLE